EASAGLLRSAGRLGFIIPSGWVSTPSSKPLRAFFLDKFVPESFVSLPFDVFVGAYIDAVIVTAKRNEKSGRPGDHAVNLVVFPHRYKIQNVDEFPRFTKMGNVGPWGRSEELEFLITSSDAELRLLGKIRTNTGSVDDFALVKRGIETYDLHETTRGMKRPVYAFDGVLQR